MPSRKTSIARFGARLAPVLAIAAAGLLLAQCDRPESPTPAKPAAEAPLSEPSPAPQVTVSPPVLTRGEIVQALSAAASRYGAGRPPAGSDPLVGRRFSVRLPFGCAGPESEPADGAADGLARWSRGADDKTIRLSLTPGDWTDSALIAGSGGKAWEAVEGFWIARPWLDSEACPAATGDPLASGPASPSPQSAGLAAVFEAGGSRLGRRMGRAYSFTVRGEADVPPTAPAEGYRLVLEGRITAFPDGRAIRCRAANPDQRPVCIVAAQLDRVAFQSGAGGEILSEWRPD